MIPSQFNNYQHYSQAAAKAEQAGDCSQALQYWLKAAEFAKTDKQQEWCENRSKFLERWGNRIEVRNERERRQREREQANA